MGVATLPQPSVRPRFVGIFPVSYGLSREQLAELNSQVQSTLGSRSAGDAAVRFVYICPPCHGMTMRIIQINTMLPYTYELIPNALRPTVFFQRPILLEVVGARFDKSPASRVCPYPQPSSISLVWLRYLT